MAVPIDNVYQKVLALCNKEQRGYVTPQEFNLFSDKAQNEIYENYFHQLNLAQRKPNSQKQHSDILESIEHKLSGFIESDLITVSTAAGGAAPVCAAEVLVVPRVRSLGGAPRDLEGVGDLHQP